MRKSRAGSRSYRDGSGIGIPSYRTRVSNIVGNRSVLVGCFPKVEQVISENRGLKKIASSLYVHECFGDIQ